MIAPLVAGAADPCRSLRCILRASRTGCPPTRAKNRRRGLRRCHRHLLDPGRRLGLKTSDDIGTNYDLKTEVYKNGTLIASGQTLCIQGIARNPDLAKQVSAPFGPPPSASFNGSTDVLALKVLTRLGTTPSGASCGGHLNAAGLRVYFDAANRVARFDATF